MKHDPKLLDHYILSTLSGSNALATYVIRNTVRYSGGEIWDSLKTSHILTACRRLEKRGLVRETNSFYRTMKEWEITDAGHQARLLVMGGGE